MSAAPAAALVDAASAPYRGAGRFAWHFARGKLSGDPVFAAILARGLLADASSLLDLGCGQGLLATWLLAARALRAGEVPGAWPQGWPAPPALERYTGFDVNAREVARGRSALDTLTAGSAAPRLTIVEADITDVDYPQANAIVLLDVLHYLDRAAQERVLTRCRAALEPRGLLLLRIGDAAAGLGFRLSRAVDTAVALARRGRLVRFECRALSEWRSLLDGLGFRSDTLPMSAGTPFANVLLVARPI